MPQVSYRIGWYDLAWKELIFLESGEKIEPFSKDVYRVYFDGAAFKGDGVDLPIRLVYDSDYLFPVAE